MAVDNLLVIAQTIGKIKRMLESNDITDLSPELKFEIDAIIREQVPAGWASAAWQGPEKPVDYIKVLCGAIGQAQGISRNIQPSTQIDLNKLLRPDKFLDALRVKAAGGVKDDSADCWFWQSATEYPAYAEQKLVSSYDAKSIKIEPESADRVIVQIAGVKYQKDATEEEAAGGTCNAGNFYIAWVPLDNEDPVGPAKGFFDSTPLELVDTPFYHRADRQNELCKLRLLGEEGYSMFI